MSLQDRGPLVDAHAHLGDEAFDDDRADVLERARKVGVRAVVVVSETLTEAQRNLELADEYGEIFRPTAGLYPTVLDREQGREIEDLIRRRRDELSAIGEVGLDHWKVKDEAGRAMQHEIFARFIELSRELELPLNVHSRSAGRATIELLLERRARRVLLHAFDGRAAKAQPAVEAGFYFSIPPSIARSRQKQKLVAQLPLANLLLETDSPVLGPTAEQRNEPANVRVSLEAIADIKGLSQAEVVESVDRNARELFGV